MRGRGFVTAEEECSADEMFLPFAHQYVDRLTGIQGQTRSNYRKFIDRHMAPWFRELSVRDVTMTITRDHVSDWVNDLENGRRGPHHDAKVKRKPLAPKTIANLHGLLYSILQHAVTADPPLRPTNPCSSTRLPRPGYDSDEEAVFLEREEYALLRAQLSDDVVDLVDALISTGLRWGEVTALQPQDLTLVTSRPTLRVRRAWKRLDSGGKDLGTPKSKKSRRTLVLSPSLVDMFRRACRGKGPKELIFTAPQGGPWDSGGFYTARWKPAVKAANECGLTKRPRIHDLRHTHASWLITKTVPLPAIQARLGHESITTTVDRYGHLLNIMDEEVTAAVEWGLESTRMTV